MPSQGEKVSDEHFLLFNCFGEFCTTSSFHMILQNLLVALFWKNTNMWGTRRDGDESV